MTLTGIALPVDAGSLSPSGQVCVYSNAHGGEILSVQEDPAGDPRYERYLDETFGSTGWNKDIIDRADLPTVAHKHADGTDTRIPALHAFKMRAGRVDTGQGGPTAVAAPGTDRQAVEAAVATYLQANLKDALVAAITELQKGGKV